MSDNKNWNADQSVIDELRAELEDYYGSASPEFPMALMDVDRVSQMDDEEVLEEARALGLWNDE